MSNFQRTRSKVWWGDSPPNIGSPIPGRFRHQQENNRDADMEEWEPQLPRWAGEEQDEEEEQGAVGGEVTPPLAHRHSSPNSHKSQDSGFSDSDSSPPQPPQPPVQNTPRNDNCCSRNEMKTPEPLPKHCYHQETPVRSVIKTPRDLHNYIEAHCDVGHVAFDSVTRHRDNTPGNPIKVVITPHKNINNNNINIEKCTKKTSLLETFNKCNDRKSTMEYIDVGSEGMVRLDNQPGVRSPIDYTKYKQRGETYFHGTSYFQRQDRFNRSFHSTYTERRVHEQISDEESHSLGYIDVLKDEDECDIKEPNLVGSFGGRKFTDSLHLKKSMLKTKQKIQHKATKIKQSRGIFNFKPKKNEPIKTIYDITKDSERIPALGLSNGSYHEWMENNSRNYNTNYDKVSNGSKENLKGILKTPKSARKITPPIQFQDECVVSMYNERRNILHADNSSCEDLYFNDQDLSTLCTSTPKSCLSDEQLKNSSMKPKNLLQTFNKSLERSSNTSGNDSEICTTPLEQICRDKELPLQQWLCSLVGHTESEVGTLLQSKPIARNENKTISQTSNTITGNIRKVHTHALIIIHTTQDILKSLVTSDRNIIRYKSSDISATVANMSEFILTHSITLKIRPPGETPERWDKLSAALEGNIQISNEIVQDVSIELNETNPEISILKKYIKSIYRIFIETTKAVLVQQMKTLVKLIEDPPSDRVLKSTLTSLGQLGRSGINDNGPCSIPLIECGIPRTLLELIIHSNKSSIKALSLRALATICTTSEAVQQFDEGGGLEILCEILAEENIPEPQSREAVTVLAQITAPWLHGHYVLSSLNKHIDVIVKNLTRILSDTSCCQLILLCAAALVNVVRSMRREGKSAGGIIEALREHYTINSLLEAVKRRGPNASVFLQEQTAALLDLVTCCAGGRVLVCECSAACVALLCFLRPSSPVTPRPSSSSPLQQAELRLLTHTTETLARLCTIPEVCERMIQLEGPSRLVRVILSHPERGVLIPLLRTLRSLYHYKPSSSLPAHLQPHIKHMIHPPLMEAVAYYLKQANKESYV